MRFGMMLAIGTLMALAGCTQPSQPIARQALTLSMQADDTHVLDLSRGWKHEALERGALALKAATRPAEEVLTDTANTWERIGWLQIQHERKQACTRIALYYIDTQEGVLNILWRRLKAAWSESRPPTEALAAQLEAVQVKEPADQP